MSTYYSQLDALFRDDISDSVVLTPNNRLGRFVQAQYALYQTQQGQTSWPSFPCHSLSNWYHELWDQLSFMQDLDGMPLSASQETALWHSIIRANSEDVELFNPAATASVARQAWHTVVQWAAQDALEKEGSSLFTYWAKLYVKQCKENSLTNFPMQVEQIIQAVADGELVLPKKLILFAFDDVPPQLQRLLEQSTEQGGEYEHFSLDVVADTKHRICLKNVDDEILSAALWAKEKVQQHSEEEIKVAVVIPQLAQIRHKVESIFTRVFEPQYILPDKARHACGFNISAATPLSAAPPIATALLALKLNFKTLDIEDLSKLLHSAFLGKSEEIPARSLLEEHLRENYSRITTALLRRKSGEGKTSSEDSRPPTGYFYQSLHEFHQLQIGFAPKQAPSVWAECFRLQLAALGWPGDRPLDTLEFQQVDIWTKTLAQLAAYDHVFNTISLSHAIELLERLAFDTPFQAQTYDSAVQVLGVLEAAGLAFDYLWVMGMDSLSWPVPVNPNALLPLAMQKREQMPLASVEKELLLAKKLTHRFEHSARQVIFSHSALDGDSVLHASALIEHLESVNREQLHIPSEENYWRTLYKSRQLEECQDACGPVVKVPKDVRGGSQILKDQAACPFRAFAKHRLGARSSESASQGIKASERGSLLHDALEILWNNLKHQDALLAMEEKELQQLIQSCIDKSFQRLEKDKKIGKRLKQLECERMERLIRAWLEVEKTRAPFSVVFSETKNTIHLAKLPIHIRYDRIDKLEDGSLFVVDYKTAKVDTRTWAGDRPDEPQVPLYGVANRENVSGLAFGQINIEQLAYKGIGESAEAVPGVSLPESLGRLDLPDSWPEILQHWNDVLEQLAKEFIAGVAEVKPKLKNVSCQFCSLHSLCRIKEFIEVDEGENQEGSVHE